jgi:hypothetical protein
MRSDPQLRNLVWRLVSASGCLASGDLASGVWRLASWRLASGVWRLASWRLASGIWRLAESASGIQRLASASGVWHLASGVGVLASGVWRRWRLAGTPGAVLQRRLALSFNNAVHC